MDESMATPSGGSSLGDAVSARGQSMSNEDDELYYIPERRPSLDLGPRPMDTSHWHYVEQAVAPALSYKSMTSEESLNEMEEEDGSSTGVQLSRTDSYSSCYSFDSDDCDKKIPKVKSNDDVSEPPVLPELIPDPNVIKHPSLTVAFTFKAICKTLGKLSEAELKTFKWMLWKRYPQSFNTPPQGMDLVDLVDRLLECYNLQVSLQITKTLLLSMEKNRIVDYLETLCIKNEVRYELCETFKKTYSEYCEDLAMEGEKRSVDDVFTNLHIMSTCGNGPNIEHEVMTIEKLDSNRKTGKLLLTKDILSTSKMEGLNVSLVLLTGMAGSGKSMAVRKLVLDWAEERSHQHVSILIPLPFKELKQFVDSEVSLLEIIHQLYPATKKLRKSDFSCEDYETMFVFDGLDEYSGGIDFIKTDYVSDHKEQTTLDVIVVNLLRGRMLRNSLILFTSRPQVKTCIPWDTHHNEIEVRGFHDSERDEYFKKRLKDPDQAAQVIAYVSSFKTLRIMCHLPLFCSVVADECQRIFREQGTQAELPRSITYMYTKLVLALMQQLRKFRAPDRSPDEERDFLMKLGRLAFTMLNQGNFKIVKTDWSEFEVNDEEAVINSGLCTEYIRHLCFMSHETVVSFIHPTVQEYLAALYASLLFRNQGKNIFELQLKDKVKGMLKGHKPMELYKSAVDRSLMCEDGKFDIFLRFLFGMTLQPNLELLQTFFTSSSKWPSIREDAAALIRKRIRDNQYPNRNSNLQHCLEELGM